MWLAFDSGFLMYFILNGGWIKDIACHNYTAFFEESEKRCCSCAFAGTTETGRFYFLLQETKKAPSLSRNPFFNMPVTEVHKSMG